MQKREGEEIACCGIKISHEEDEVDQKQRNVDTIVQRAYILTKAPTRVELCRHAEDKG